MSKATKRTSSQPGFVPLGTKEQTETFLVQIAYLRHHVFTTSRYFPDGRCEQWSWNVTEGYELARDRYSKQSADSLDGWDTFDPSEHGITITHILERYPGLDIRYAVSHADLSEPVLFVPAYEIVDGERVDTLLLIDGWHRLFRSVVEATESGKPCPLRAYILTEDEAKAIQIAPPALEPGSIEACPGTIALRQLSRRMVTIKT